MIWGFWDVSRPPKTNCLSLEKPGYQKGNQEKPWNIKQNIVSGNLRVREIHLLTMLEKGGHRNMMKIRLIKF